MADEPGKTPPPVTPGQDGITPPPPAVTTPPEGVTPPVVVTPPVAPPNVVKLQDAPPKGETPPVDFTASLKPENKLSIEKSGFKSMDAVVEAYNALRIDLQNKGLFGDLPADATPAQRAEWIKARGTPDVPDAYTLTMPETMPKDMPYDATFAESFKNWSHEIGLTPWQANQLHNHYVSMMANSFQEVGTKANEQVTQAHQALVKAWGNPDTEAYNKNVEMAQRAMRHLDPNLSAELKEVGILATDGTVVKPAIAKALAVAGHKLFSEDTLYGSGSTPVKNPWTKGEENLTEQGRIYSADPERARRLATAAGAPPPR